ncbi:SDR family oxidoreductase [Furfurilactobacillus siliginis]|uniref:Aldehyde reductase n=1 Tax=Furfurilactobacillus siliginis TaxID=348151 RepID=A0A0R2L2P3_9LACO|nr:aldehyde reductase [Furfurilactobacillus siliginis]KRN94102.1 hypothetical protein IV55_GL000615 [Furfurilactobacillus siliginis]GEK29094.1 aldehyde reductase [Furfurilactobacillus siliginis]
MAEKVLVTGGTGFLGSQLILQLLQRGADVRTTVRSLAKKEGLIKTLQDNGIQNTDQLSFAVADLSSDDGWDAAMADREYVFSVASPVFFEEPKSEEAAIRPAVDGISRVLQAALRNHVKRVVMTSNFGAVGFSKHRGADQVTTEADWTDPEVPGLSIYEKSKLLAEKAAWQLMDAHKDEMSFATVNPVAIFGPSLNEHISGSFMLIENLVNGSMQRIPNLPLNVVDVRDVADIHIRAMFTPAAAGKRFIASADGQISLREMADLIRRERPQAAAKITTKKLPDFVIDLGAPFNAQAKAGKLMKNMNRNVANDQAKTILGWRPRSTSKETVLAAVDSMLQYDLIK